MLLNTCALSVLVNLILFTHVHSTDINITESCVNLYEKGVQAYLDNEFSDCVTNLEKALKKYHEYREKLQSCRIRCKEDAQRSEPLYPVDIDDLLFYEKAVKATLCIIKCKREKEEIFGGFNINYETEKLFEDFKPYEYLHICYFQEKDAQKAASAAFTYLTAHTDDKVMAGNLRHYSLLKEVDMKQLINFEAKEYVYLYTHGAHAYGKKDWQVAVDNMEESLIAYLQADEECRVQCEGPFDHGWYPDLMPSIANHFTFCLKCKLNCEKKLSSLNGEKHDDLLPSHYHYLQYAYYKLGKLKDACQAVESYLLFFPTDEVMLSNKNFYQNLPDVQEDYFRPRPEAVNYVHRMRYENRLMKFIMKEYQFKPTLETEKLEAKTKYEVIKGARELNGSQRFVSDGLATRKQCNILLDIVKLFAVIGDGYKGKKSPHTLMEKFEGVTISRAALLVYIGLLNSKHLELYLQITENVRKILKDYFKLTQELYFSYTHLVCRSALNCTENRDDFSHAIHADNCNIFEDGECEKAPPAYTWRDYSAILYLNEDFEGGEFLFSQDPSGKKVQSIIKPKCGRMVGFSSGKENLHGVKAVKRGSRCAVGIWFTYDKDHLEKDRNIAYQLLQNLQ